MPEKAFGDYIDHTLLRPTATQKDIGRLCAQAQHYSFVSVCVNPIWVPLAASHLEDFGIVVGTVVGFPLGASGVETKAFEAVQAVNNGAKEIDMVINIAALKAQQYPVILDEIIMVRQRMFQSGRKIILKIILECCYLTNKEKIKATTLCADAGADFVKTSTGFGPGGATIDDVNILKRAAEGRIQIKAAGGISDYATAQAMIEAGAARIGTSAGVELMTEYRAKIK